MIEAIIYEEIMQTESALELVVWALEKENSRVKNPVLIQALSSLRSFIKKFRKCGFENRLLAQDLKPIIFRLKNIEPKQLITEAIEILELFGGLYGTELQIQAQRLLKNCDEN